MLRVALYLLVALFLSASCGGDLRSSEDPPAAPVTTTAGSLHTTGSTATPSAGAAIPSGGLSVQEALDSPLRRPLMVRGHLFVTPNGAALCSRIVLADGPSCGSPSLPVIGLTDEDVAREATTSDGELRWSAEVVSLLGNMTSGEFRVAPKALG